MVRFRRRSSYRSRRFFDPFEPAAPRTSSRRTQKLLAKIRASIRDGDDSSRLVRELIRRYSHNPSLFGPGRPVFDEELERAVTIGVDILYPEEIATLTVLLMEVPRHGLTHGILFAERILGLVLFFEEMGQGLIVVSEIGREEAVCICRITRIEVPHPPFAQPN